VLKFSIGINYPAPADRTWEEMNHIPAAVCCVYH
jgi:hypothetical protein